MVEWSVFHKLNMIKNLDFNTENLEDLSPSSLKRVSDYWLRQYLLKKVSVHNGKIKCPIKNKFYTLDKMQVSHFIDRANMITRYDLDNCHLISVDSNCFEAQIIDSDFKSKHHKDYENFLLREIGENRLNILKSKKDSLEIFTKDDYIEKINFFRNECRR